MKSLLSRSLALALLAASLGHAHAATYLLLSQTNALAAGITNLAKAYTDSVVTGGDSNTIVLMATNSAKAYTDAHNSTNAANWVASGTTNSTITGNVIQGASTGMATNPVSSVYGPGLSIYGTGSVDPYLRLHRGDEVLGLDLWSDSSTGNVYFDHQHNSDATGFLFRRKIRSGTAAYDFGMIGTNSAFYNTWQINGSFIGVTNQWKLKHGVSTHPTFQSSGINQATRLYLIPQSVPASGLISGIKLFGSDFDSDMVNYDDFGLLNSVDGNYINTKINGTGVLKPLFFTKQDNQVAMWIDLTNMVVHARDIRVTNNVEVGGTNFVSELVVTNGAAVGALRSPTITAGSVSVTNNIAYLSTTPVADVINLDAGFSEETVSGAVTIAHGTNGVAAVLKSAVKSYYNPSGSDQTLTIPALWRTNAFSAVPTALTNGWITVLRLTSFGSTASAATQTNCYVTFSYFH